MKILKNESLKKYTTVKIGGQAKNLYFPESVKELIDLINIQTDKELYILGGGSNILMNDQKTYENVIGLTKMDETITNLGDGSFYVGASFRVQNLINIINKEGYCGIEYLYSVPALVGGAIVMNAGRGRVHGLSISDYIEEVHVYDKGTIRVFSKYECGFKYRNSIFKNSKFIVLGVKFKFDKIDSNEPRLTKQDRVLFSKKIQDYSGNSFGSVFCEQDRRIMRIIRFIHPGYKNGMAFSKKTSNWLVNKGEGTYSQAITLIKRVEKVHKIVGKEAIPEVIIWK